MELKYVLITLLKILVSTPSSLLILTIPEVRGTTPAPAATNNAASNSSSEYYDYESAEGEDPISSKIDGGKIDSEEIPDPSPLVLPGYNLPENIFNRGKPFYVEKDPLTGQIDFDHKSPALRLDNEYEYVNEEPSDNIYDKANINRKDGSIGSHRPSDVNQLTPNFHDFLNLPVKYNPDKYVYPLISSSYASTKIQGSVNKFHNHKDYALKTTSYKPTVSPTYYSTYSPYFSKALTSTTTTTKPTTTTTRPTTVKKYPEITLTTKPSNLLDNAMSYQNFNEGFEDEYVYDIVPTTTTKKLSEPIYITTSTPTPPSSTKRIISLFEQLFGDYDDMVTTTQPPRSTLPSMFANLPSNKYKGKFPTEIKTEKPSYTPSSTTTTKTSTSAKPSGSNVLTGSNMGLEPHYDYEYDEKYENKPVGGENKVVQKLPEDDLSIEPLQITLPPPTPTSLGKANYSEAPYRVGTVSEYDADLDYKEMDEVYKVNTSSTTAAAITTKPNVVFTFSTEPIRVTSLPLGENHITTSSVAYRDPIIVATQNLREKLNSEKVLPKPFEKPPSTSNIHIAHNQNTVSFVVGNQQTVEGTSLKESPYDSNPFRPLYGQQSTYSNDNSVSYTIQAEPEASFQLSPPSQNYPEVVGSAVTIQPLKHSEASLAIGVPISSIKQVHGQVMDEKLEADREPTEVVGTKVVFPSNDEEFSKLIPPSLRQRDPVQNNNILSFNSKPLYHQLPSDLTPPKENKPGPSRPMRPPWDPRPGHFHSGKPEYSRPPRPDVAYKRIDNLPNILPQFRPNMKKHNVPFFQENRLVRQPLLERPSNRPIGYYEKLQPPPPSFPPRQNLQLRNSLDESDEERRRHTVPDDQFGLYQTPPQIKIANRRSDDDEVETLQMIQAKGAEKPDEKDTPHKVTQVVNIPPESNKDHTEKSIYKVYPVNTPPIKLDVIDSNNKESVVIGTRAELPLPPSKINKDFLYDQNPLFDQKDRNDAPILKPHPRPPTFPIKSDFPYPLERPDPSLNHPAVPETPSKNGNDLDEIPIQKYDDNIFSSNQWNTVGESLESRIVTGQKVNAPNSNQISATLKTFTEKPIAIAYTPTEPSLNADKYHMKYDTSNKEFTVSAIMHTQKQGMIGSMDSVQRDSEDLPNHKVDIDGPNYPKLDFEAPFQASVKLDNTLRNGWSVVRDKNKTTTDTAEITTLPYGTTSEFDIENFKPQLEGGFKPIYSFPEENNPSELKVNEREE